MRLLVRGALATRRVRAHAIAATAIAVLAAGTARTAAEPARAASSAAAAATAGPSRSPAPDAPRPVDATPGARLAIDEDVLAAQPEPIARALRANVVLERDEGAGRTAMVAAGVILQLRDGVATIVTAQHVVDPRFTGAKRAPAQPEALPAITVASIGGMRVRARIEWLAPHGVDLAIVSAPLRDAEARAAMRGDDTPVPKPGERVFTIGNPQGGAWTRVDGTVKQQREALQDGRAVVTLWSDLVVQPGFGGGGLYDAQGRLVAIDSKRGAISSGLQGRALLLSTALRTLVELAPAELLRAR